MSEPNIHCIDFRREKLADPRHLSETAEEHLIACPACQRFSRRINVQERLLQQAASIDVPDGLADRIIVASRSRTAAPLRLWALAATLLLSVGVGWQYTHRAPGQQNIALAVEHVLHEPEALMSTRLVEPERVAQVFENFGAQVRVPLATVRYAKLCPVPGGTGWHIVFDTEHGPVTLLLMPQQTPATERGRIITASYRGMGVHVEPGGQGMFAVVAVNEDRARAAAGMLRQHVTWNTAAAVAPDA